MWAAVFPGRDYFKAKLGRIQQGDSKKSGTTFRPEANSFQTKKTFLRAMSRIASGCTSLATLRPEIKLLNDGDLRAGKTRASFVEMQFFENKYGLA
jgi:hypothetical protein